MALNKLPITNLPVSNAPLDSYERILNVKLNEIFRDYRRTINTLIQNEDLPVYASNAAAKSGGLVDGEFYRTSTGAVMVVYT